MAISFGDNCLKGNLGVAGSGVKGVVEPEGLMVVLLHENCNGGPSIYLPRIWPTPLLGEEIKATKPAPRSVTQGRG